MDDQWTKNDNYTVNKKYKEIETRYKRIPLVVEIAFEFYKP